jgi:CubicO group peptidase (beta-lactamase class C family)
MMPEEMKCAIDALIEKEHPDHIPGLSLLIGKKGEILHSRGYGFSNLEDGKMCQSDSKYLIASVTKQFACMALMMLKEEGLIDYDESVIRYFRDFPEWFEGITVRHLMTHTSGIPDYYSEAFIKRFGTGENDGAEISEVIEMIRGYELEFEPGSNHRYSNSGYVMMHRIIEMISGMSFEDFIQDRIFTPLEMSDSLIPTGPKRIDKAAIGYKKTGKGQFEREIYNKTILGWADGNIMSTVEDLLKWSQALETEDLVKKETMNEAFESYILTDGRKANYGFGHFLFDGRGVNEIWHTGGIEGYRTNFKRFPDEGMELIMLTNISPSKDPFVDQLFEKVVNLVMKDYFKEFATVELEEKDQMKYQCRFVSDRLEGDLYFNDEGLLVFEPDNCENERMKEVFRYIGNDVFMSIDSSAITCSYSIQGSKASEIVLNRFGLWIYSKEVKASSI